MRVKEASRHSSTFEDFKGKGGGGRGSGTSSHRPRHTGEDDTEQEERASDFSVRDSCRSMSSDMSDDNDNRNKLQSPYKSKFSSDINRISFKSENSDFFLETESPLEHEQVM